MEGFFFFTNFYYNEFSKNTMSKVKYKADCQHYFTSQKTVDEVKYFV